SVPGRPGNVMRPFISVRPGVHAPERGDHRVVWWDPTTLELNVRASNGLAQTRILEEEDGGRAGEAGAAYERWKVERAASRERGGKATHVIAPATEWLREDGAKIDGDVQVLEVAREGERPRGRRFGTLVHAVLSVVGLEDDRERTSQHALVQSRILGASEAEREAAVEAVGAALAHPLLRRAAAAARDGRCRRESPLVVRGEDGTLLESVVDLAFLEEGAWQVIDFKTDAELSSVADVYRRQVALYVTGITQATGLPARGTILKV
ncbi:MAG TPA: PD-(D/E)XK nuclease family protein, partial [Candidatus Polarisedimenticolia bacterium]|nr:PD-(D/E)XK nuclease family protein [Candidatus Polarisedimenticolia bacterium]